MEIETEEEEAKRMDRDEQRGCGKGEKRDLKKEAATIHNKMIYPQKSTLDLNGFWIHFLSYIKALALDLESVSCSNKHHPIKATQRYLIGQSTTRHEKRADSSHAKF